jgi:hypothetical protein
MLVGRSRTPIWRQLEGLKVRRKEIMSATAGACLFPCTTDAQGLLPSRQYVTAGKQTVAGAITE